MEQSCPSCGLSVPVDPRFPREECPACGESLIEPPLVKGALRTPDGLHEFLELCGPYVDQKPAAPKDLDDVTAIVKVVPKKRKKSDDDEEVTAAMPRTPKKSKRGH